jgi:NADH-quinone oxidoreductase subunit A
VSEYLPILIQVGIVLGFGAVALAVSVLLGKAGRRTATKDSAYECGMLPQGEAQPRFSVKFYLVAMLFILFDIEVVFLYPWAVNFKDMLHTHGSTIFWSMTGFLTLVTVGYVYAIKKGVLDWKGS